MRRRQVRQGCSHLFSSKNGASNSDRFVQVEAAYAQDIGRHKGVQVRSQERLSFRSNSFPSNSFPSKSFRSNCFRSNWSHGRAL